MLLRSVTKHVARQDWFAVVIDFAIVVVGILMALAVEQWISERGDRREELQIMLAMEEDIVASIDRVAYALEEIDYILDGLRFLTEAGDPSHPSVEAADVDYHLANGLWETAIYATEMNTYSEVLSSGRLALIDDARIRRSLADYERSFQLSQKMFNDVFEHQQIKVDPYMLENLNMPQLVREQASRRQDRSVDLKVVVPARDHRLLLQNEQFQNQVTAKFFLATEYRKYTDGVIQALNDLAMLVRQRTEVLESSMLWGSRDPSPDSA